MTDIVQGIAVALLVLTFIVITSRQDRHIRYLQILAGDRDYWDTRCRPQKRPVTRPCPKCACLTLTKKDHDLYIRCGNETCEAVFTEAELNDDAARRAHTAAA